MRIAILGTKGIPNNYGGYEQFAEFISQRFVERGHSVTVYNPHYHKFTESEFGKVKIIRKFSPEKWIGGAANIIYDYLCLKDALTRDFDIVYEAGYHSVAPAFKFLKVNRIKHPVVITNMDGLEWRRSKWSKLTQDIIKKLEALAVKQSPHLISDNEGIRDYLKEKYGADSFYLPYGADPVEKFDKQKLARYEVKEENYFMLVARLEPENNVETILDGYLDSGSTQPFLVVGNHATTFGRFLKKKFSNTQVRFVGGLYDKTELDSLRHFASAYFHGHSVGGTNPSLLEAMASQSFIIAHDNPFNRAILSDAAFYFGDRHSVKSLILNIKSDRATRAAHNLEANLTKIKTLYNWDIIVEKHEELFLNLLKHR